MTTFEEGCAWFYLMNADLDMFKIVLPYEIVRDLWTRLGLEAPCTDETMRDWLNSNSVRLFIPIHYRAQVVHSTTDHDDYRVSVIPIDKDSLLYKAALADRRASVASKEETLRFGPEVRFIYGPNDNICDDNLNDLRPETAPPQPAH
jgi:hypothetical protein